MRRIAHLMMIVVLVAHARCGGGGGTPGSGGPSVPGRGYGGSGNDYAWSVQQASDNAYVFAGFSDGPDGAGGYDAWVARIDASGNMIGQRRFGGPGNDYAFSIQRTSDGGYVVAGVDNEVTGRLPTPGVWLPLDFSGELTLRKLDADLNLAWEKKYGAFSIRVPGCETYYPYSTGYVVRQVADGGYIVVGATGNGVGGGQTLLLKTDGAGDNTWHVFLDGEIGTGVRQSADGGYVVSTSNAGLFKVGPGGALEWSRLLNGSALAVWESRDGGFVVAGDGIDNDVLVAKVAPDNTMLWNWSFGSPGGGMGYSVQQASDNGCIVAGGGGGTVFNHRFDVSLVKLDGAGNKVWERYFGGTGDDVGRSVSQTPDGGYIVAGSTTSLGAGGVDAYIVKTDAAGVPRW